MKKIFWAAFIVLPFIVNGQNWQGKFEQLGSLLPSPNGYRTASGHPGHSYWQQKADYSIEVTIDEKDLILSGKEQVTFHNNSPHTLTYLWFQLDQNVRKKNALSWQTNTNELSDEMEAQDMMSITDNYFYEGGYTIKSVKKESGTDYRYVINETMMRVDLDQVLKPGESVKVYIAWSYHLYDRLVIDGRGGYEYFPKDDNYIFTVAQWYPRLAVYNDVEGWQNKQFLGQGEFALTFGDYAVKITAPADHLVAATGVLQNSAEVLTAEQLKRLKQAAESNEPVFIVNEKEARKAEKSKASVKKTWYFKAENVRDFAFASSRKFIWDAMAVPLATTTPMAMSFYPKEGNPLWENFSTKAVANALLTYSAHTFDYPYPVAISVHTADQGMEYPMICFNGGRPNENGKYSQYRLEGMISVIVHEVGHNYFPMIVNSDERQWTWMDEGLNTFLELQTLVEHYPELGVTYGTPKSVTNYMMGNPDFIRPIMTNSEQIVQFGYNAYGKPSAALSVLREVVMGKELFDYAFKNYARTWAFKSPMPADFFRSMEDASAVDLDWFWRGWFFTTDYVDVAIGDIKYYRLSPNLASKDEKPENVEKPDNQGLDIADSLRLKTPSFWQYGEFKNRLDDNVVLTENLNDNIYEVTFKNIGGLVTPLILQWTYDDGTKEVEIIPAEIWRMSEKEVTKVFIKTKKVVHLQIDPEELTGDTDTINNSFPYQATPTRIETFKSK